MVVLCLSMSVVHASDISGDGVSINDAHNLNLDDAFISVTPINDGVDAGNVISDSNSFHDNFNHGDSSSFTNDLSVQKQGTLDTGSVKNSECINVNNLNNDGSFNSGKNVDINDIPKNATTYNYKVSSEKDFKNLINDLKSSNKTFDYVSVDIINDINVSSIGSVLSLKSNNTFLINCNGKTIKFLNAKYGDEDHFLYCGENSKVLVNDLTLSGFTTTIVNDGYVDLKNIVFSDNLNAPGNGGAISNHGALNCVNCAFLNNMAFVGGAIYSTGPMSRATLVNCYFNDNSVSFGGRDDVLPSLKKYGTKVVNYVLRSDFAVVTKSGRDVYVCDGGILYSYSFNNDADALKGPLYGPNGVVNNLRSTPNSKIEFGYDESNPTIVLRDSLILLFVNLLLKMKLVLKMLLMKYGVLVLNMMKLLLILQIL